MSKLALFVIALCCLYAFSNAAYLQRNGYYSNSCAAPLVAYEFDTINTCVSNSSGNGQSFKITTTSTDYTQTFYLDSACTTVNTTINYPLGACVNVSSEISNSASRNILNTISSPISGVAGVVSFYGNNCGGDRTNPITRTIYSNQCSDYSAAANGLTASGYATCNATTIYVNLYLGSTCSGAPIYTTVVGSLGCQPDGTVSECLTIPVSATTASTTSPPGNGAATGTTTTYSSSSTMITPCFALLFALAMLFVF